MVRVKRVDRNRPNARWNASLRARQKSPLLTGAVGGLVNPNSGIGIRGKIGFTGAAINQRRILRIDRERTNIQNILLMPHRLPRLTGVVAMPDTAPGCAGPNAIRMLGMTDDTRHPSADIGWSNRFPTHCARLGQRLLNPRALPHQNVNRSFP